MRRIWAFFRNPRNLAVLTAAGAAIAFLWSKLEPKAADPAPPPAAQQATALGSGNAVNAAGTSQVVIGGGTAAAPDAPGAKTPAPPSGPVAGQVASANGGHAVNARDGANVRIDDGR